MSLSDTIFDASGGMKDWEPTYIGTGSLTFTSVVTRFARYRVIGKTMFFSLVAIGTTGGVTDLGIRFSLPFTAIAELTVAAAYVYDGQYMSGFAHLDPASPNIVQVMKYNLANFALGLGREIGCQGFVELP